MTLELGIVVFWILGMSTPARAEVVHESLVPAGGPEILAGELIWVAVGEPVVSRPEGAIPGFGFGYATAVDILPPRSWLSIGTPRADGADGDDGAVFVTGATSITLRSIDDYAQLEDGDGLGVLSQTVVFDASAPIETRTVESGRGVVFQSTFSLHGRAEGPHLLEYFATDLQGQQGAATHMKLVLDDSGPNLSYAFGSAPVIRPPKFEPWFAANLTIEWSATDQLSGVSWASTTTVVDAEGRSLGVVGRASDRLGNLGSTTVVVNIDKTPPVVDAGPGLVISEGGVAVLRGSVSDNLDDEPLFSWTFADGQPHEVLVATRVYDQDGTFYAILASTDHAGHFAFDTAEIKVVNAPPKLKQISDKVSTEGDELFVRADFTDPGLYDSHSATIQWGDGTISSATVTESRGSGAVSGNHIYADNGTFAATVTVTDDDGGAASTTFKVVVANAPPVVNVASASVAGAGGIAYVGGSIPVRTIPAYRLPDRTRPVGVPVGPDIPVYFPAASFEDPGFDNPAARTREDFTAIIDWGDGTSTDSSAFDLIKTTGSGGVPTIGVISAARHEFAENGVYNVRITVFDDDGGAASTGTTVTVDRVSPVTTPGFEGLFVEGPADPGAVPSGLDVYLGPASRIALSAEDPLEGGVAFGVQNRFWREGSSGYFNVYEKSFGFLSPGFHPIEYFSVDYRGNEEEHHILKVGVDLAAPEPHLVIGEPRAKVFGLDLISPDTPISLWADDRISEVSAGLKEITYRIDDGPLLSYSTAFFLPKGAHVIDYGAADRVGNEKRRTFSVAVATFQFGGVSGPLGVSGTGTSDLRGLIQSNGPVSLSGSVRVDGDVIGATVTLKGQAEVTGTIIQGAGPLAEEPIDVDLVEALARAASSNALIPAEFLQGDELVVDAGRNLSLSTGVYVVSGLRVNGSGNLDVLGKVEIFVEGEVRINGGGRLNADGKASQLTVIASSGPPIHFSGGAEVVGMFYAPRGRLEIAGNSRLGGRFFGRRVMFTGTSNVVAGGETLPEPVVPVGASAGTDDGRGKGKGSKAAAAFAPAGVDPAFALGEVYAFPNPATRGAAPTIHAEVGIADQITIKIFDVAGREAHRATLYGTPGIVDDGTGPSYAYESRWGGHIPSGVYLYSIVAEKLGQGKIVKTGKLAVIR